MIEIYTDGSSAKIGSGYGTVVMLDSPYIISEYFEEGTNNQMELKAIIAALEFAKEHKEDKFIIYSDSAYCVNMCNEWIFNWAAAGWRRGKNKEILNLDLVKKIYSLLDTTFECNYIIEKVDGHSGNIGNEIADAVATRNKVKLNKFLEKYEREVCNF